MIRMIRMILIREIAEADTIITEINMEITAMNIADIRMTAITITRHGVNVMIPEIRRQGPWLLPAAISAAEQRSLEPVSAVTAVIS